MKSRACSPMHALLPELEKKKSLVTKISDTATFDTSLQEKKLSQKHMNWGCGPGL